MAKLKFHYIKSAQHREILVDGAIGSIGPSNRIALTVYAERAAFPRVVVHELSENGVLGDEVQSERVGKDGIARSVEATLHMDLEKAEAIHQWLGERISELRSVRGDQNGSG